MRLGSRHNEQYYSVVDSATIDHRGKYDANSKKKVKKLPPDSLFCEVHTSSPAMNFHGIVRISTIEIFWPF